MKHPLSITALLVGLFIAAQVIGLALLSLNIKGVETVDGKVVVQHDSTALGDRPAVSGYQSVLYLLVGVAVGTALLLILIKYKVFTLWKVWFLIAIWFSSTVALGVLIPSTIAFILCLGLAVWKVFKPNPIVHNLTEILMYAGLAILLAPIFTPLWVIVLLIIISIYDVIAVWHSKHMVVMAKAQTERKLFAGLYIPKTEEKITKAMSHSTMKRPIVSGIPAKPTGQSAAILGGGDIAFPLIFSGVIMDWLITAGTSRIGALYESLIITATTAIALSLLFAYAKKDRFYPAMPFLTAGCLVGLGIIIVLNAI